MRYQIRLSSEIFFITVVASCFFISHLSYCEPSFETDRGYRAPAVVGPAIVEESVADSSVPLSASVPEVVEEVQSTNDTLTASEATPAENFGLVIDAD